MGLCIDSKLSRTTLGEYLRNNFHESFVHYMELKMIQN